VFNSVTQASKILRDFMGINVGDSNSIVTHLDLVLRQMATHSTTCTDPDPHAPQSVKGGGKPPKVITKKPVATTKGKVASTASSNNNKAGGSSASSGSSSAAAADILYFHSFLSIVDELLKNADDDAEQVDPDANTQHQLQRRTELLKQLRLFLAACTDSNVATSAAASMAAMNQLNACGFDHDSVLGVYKVCLSGVVRRQTQQAGGSSSVPASSMEMYGLQPVDGPKITLTKKLWDLNMDQIKQLYAFYASSVCEHTNFEQYMRTYAYLVPSTGSASSTASGSSSSTLSSKLMLDFDNCKDFLMDAGIIPQYIDILVSILDFVDCIFY
jgi:hypothetical protein